MARCFLKRETRDGKQVWGNSLVEHVLESTGLERVMVERCKRAFEGKYAGYWIRPIYFDDAFSEGKIEMFDEIGAELYLRVSDDMLTDMRYTTPVKVIVRRDGTFHEVDFMPVPNDAEDTKGVTGRIDNSARRSLHDCH